MLIGMYSHFILVTEKKNEFSRLIKIGSCGLHVLHGALQTGIMEKDWEVSKVLHAM